MKEIVEVDENKYNPYISSYIKIKDRIEFIENENRELKDKINWYESNKKEDLIEYVDILSNEEKIKSQDLEKLKHNLSLANNNYSKLKKKALYGIINPFLYFSASQKIIRNKLGLIKKEIGDLDYKIKSRKKELDSIIDRRKKIQFSLEKYISFDYEKTISAIKKNERTLPDLYSELQIIEEKKKKLQDLLDSTLKELYSVQNKIIETEKKIREADNLNKKLNDAYDAYDRKMIHEESEERFGDGKPLNIIKQQEGLKRKLIRDFNKLDKRAIGIRQKVQREINSIIIDGNNMCYDSDGFIGLNALLSVSTHIRKKFQLTIVFDASIRSILKKSNDNIINQFDSNIKVHIVASSVKADETIIKLASEKLDCYIISNDRFIDYFDEEAVKSKRIIRHEIVNNRVLISDLDIDFSF